MIRGITWTHIQSVWNHSGPSEEPYSATSQDFFADYYSKPALASVIVSCEDCSACIKTSAVQSKQSLQLGNLAKSFH